MNSALRTFFGIASLVVLTLSSRAEAIPLVSVGSTTVNAGDILSIPVSITGVVNLTSFQFDLSFNSSILHVTETGISESPFFTQTDITVFNAGFVDNNAGSVLGVSDALIFQTPVNGSGIIANIEFNSIAVGTSPLTLSKVFLNLSDTGFSLSNGAVCVKLPTETGCRVDNAIPEPGTATLVAMGLVLLSSRRRMTLH